MGNQYVVVMLFAIAIVANCIDISTELESMENLFQHNLSREKFTHLQFYVRDVLSGPICTNIAVAMANTTFASPTLFELVAVLDDRITVGPEPDSKTIGQAQGLLALSSLEEMSIHMTITLVFTSGQYNGSSLNLVGQNPYLTKLRRVPVVGGTGSFLLARGVTLINTVSSDSLGDATFQYNVYVLHY